MTTTTQTRTRSRPKARATGPAKAAAPRRPARTRKATEPATKVQAEQHPKESGADLVTWQDVPMPHLKVPVVHMGGAAGAAVERAGWTARTVTAAVPRPRPRQLMYYGGVGALAALGILEWPVALAAAAGVWVATHDRRTAAATGG
ncbi:hypothetical protein KZZ52_31685 [Dactylosporangium sp. AC04546]|uniref:hypothetical protein n=1 Tax=Dactylosporangium sp. AC04546 TaxID=2862460 RepID=UPI001EE04BAB|nr:hypothetical protein [Dactylosporangium sp. AC04546]WVK78553.1 hypothetical protein KZZ52_31685 [Dactylosporangium sp. AC04546]